MKPIRSIRNDHYAARDGRRAVLAAMLLIFVAATSLSDGRFIPDFTARNVPVAVGSKPGDETPTDDEFRTGSILFTPSDGNICELRLIDNATWRIHSGGQVECDEAVSWHSQRGDVYTPQSRIEAIRDGFVSKR